jgi:hypothetical protein
MIGALASYRIPYSVVWLLALALEDAARGDGQATLRPAHQGSGRRTNTHVLRLRGAVKELGLPQAPGVHALRDAVDWFVAHPYTLPPGGSEDGC